MPFCIRLPYAVPQYFRTCIICQMRLFICLFLLAPIWTFAASPTTQTVPEMLGHFQLDKAKLTEPLERIFGTSLLGITTAQRVQFYKQTAVSGGGGQ